MSLVSVAKTSPITAQPFAFQEIYKNTTAAALAPTIILDEILDTCKTDESTSIFISPTYSYTADPACQTAGNPTYAWIFPGGTDTTNDPSTPPNIEYTTPGVYTVTVSVTDACGESDSKSRTFEIFATPIINTGSSSAGLQEVCQTETAPTLTITATNVGSSSYQWYANTTDQNSGGTELTSETSATYTPPTNVVGTVFYYAVIRTPECGDQPGPTSEITV
ncbi:MAG: PKD domain-containing protein, partial [Flavobacteriales bacterium]